MASFFYLPEPKLFLPLYALSCLLDAADGHFARLLNQCSKLGAVLDMVTDRSTTAGLTCYLGHIFPHYMVAFQVLIGLDLSSHYMHMYSSLLGGSESHKNIKKDSNVILRLYYTSRTVLFWVCALNELFYIALYCLYHESLVKGIFSRRLQDSLISLVGYSTFSINVAAILLGVCAPVWGFKQFINVIQLIGAAQHLASLDSGALSKGKSAQKRPQ